MTEETKSVPVCTTITGEVVAAPFRTLIQQSTSGKARPKLIGILANVASNGPSRIYASWTAKACEAVGIEYELREVSSEDTENGATQVDVEQAILQANIDPSVNGIMVYYPIFGPRKDGYLQQAVSPLKDVEGLHFTWLFSLYHNIRFVNPSKLSTTELVSPTSPPAEQAAEGDRQSKAILPCTPLAIVKVLEYCQVYNTILPYGSRAFGKTITVINRSEVVGRPLAALLANDGARVFSVDLDGIQEFTRRKISTSGSSFHPHHVVQSCSLTLEECLRASDAVVAGVPSKEYKVKTEHLKEGVVAINFSENKNFELDIKEKAALYCPGIGKVTICMLQRNLLRLQEYQQTISSA